MNELTFAERLRLEAAEGWLMLGNPLEAHEELEQLSGESARHPAVLAARWQVYASASWWEAAFVVSKALCGVAPDSVEAWLCQANSLRNYRGVTDAWSLLLSVLGKFPDDAILRYNLACYAAQLNLLDESCGWLVQAFELEDCVDLKLAALHDPDLQPLWDKIGRQRVQEITGPVPPLAALQHWPGSGAIL